MSLPRRTNKPVSDQWDGEGWPAVGQLNSSGRWRWDGEGWQPADELDPATAPIPPVPPPPAVSPDGSLPTSRDRSGYYWDEQRNDWIAAPRIRKTKEEKWDCGPFATGFRIAMGVIAAWALTSVVVGIIVGIVISIIASHGASNNNIFGN